MKRVNSNVSLELDQIDQISRGTDEQSSGNMFNFSESWMKSLDISFNNHEDRNPPSTAETESMSASIHTEDPLMDVGGEKEDEDPEELLNGSTRMLQESCSSLLFAKGPLDQADELNVPNDATPVDRRTSISVADVFAPTKAPLDRGMSLSTIDVFASTPLPASLGERWTASDSLLSAYPEGVSSMDMLRRSTGTRQTPLLSTAGMTTCVLPPPLCMSTTTATMQSTPCTMTPLQVPSMGIVSTALPTLNAGVNSLGRVPVTPRILTNPMSRLYPFVPTTTRTANDTTDYTAVAHKILAETDNTNTEFGNRFAQIVPLAFQKKRYEGAMVQYWHEQAHKLARGEESTLTLSQQEALSQASFPWNFDAVLDADQVFAFHQSAPSDRLAPIEANGLETALTNAILKRVEMDPNDESNKKHVKYLQFLVPYRMRHGDYQVSKRAHGSMGKHVENLRSQGSRNPKYKQALDLIHFSWEVRDPAWEEMFQQLVAYKAESGNCLVPKRIGGLGAWVCKQRMVKRDFDRCVDKGLAIHGKASKLDRIQRLDAIGMIWNPR